MKNIFLTWVSRACSALRRPAGHVEPDVSATPDPIAELRQAVASLNEAVSSLKAEQTEARDRLAAVSRPVASGDAAVATPSPAAAVTNGKKSATPGTDRSAVIGFNKQFLTERYDLRYNVLKRTTEFRAKPTPHPTGESRREDEGQAGAWQPLTDRDLNRLTTEQLEAGGGSWSYGMRLCIESSDVPSYNPVLAYLDSLPDWDGYDHIGDLAHRVPTVYSRWPEFFRRWMLAMVAQTGGGEAGFRFQDSGFWFRDSGSRFHGNSMVPLLIGGQGLRKTTFCRLLLPPELREYFMDDIKMDSAEQVERVLARMWLVCIDEYNAKTPREQAKIKRLLTEKDVQVRRPRSDEYRLVPRLASFIATTNDATPLPEGDGTRRYLCIEVEGSIDTDSPVDHRQIYAQALHELQQGARYWFDADDEAEIQRHNAPYQQASPLESVLPTLFEPTHDRRRENLWQVQAVQKVLATHLRTADIPNLRQTADAMKALRWPQGAVCGTRGYYLTRKDA